MIRKAGFAWETVEGLLEYAREVFQLGAVLVVDEGTAHRWIKAKLADAAPKPEAELVRTTCPRCGSAMEYPAEPAPEERWTQCGNPACGHGWVR